MENLFLLAERIVDEFKKELSKNQEDIGYFSFEKSSITNSRMELIFTDESRKIKCNLSVHPLDMPWELVVLIQNYSDSPESNIEIFNKSYTVNPKLLKDPNVLGGNLAILIVKELIDYLKRS